MLALHFAHSIAAQNWKRTVYSGLTALYLPPNVQFFTVSQNPLVHIFAVYQVKALVAKVQYMLSSQKQDDGGGIDI